jgi:hypothetical protein
VFLMGRGVDEVMYVKNMAWMPMKQVKLGGLIDKGLQAQHSMQHICSRESQRNLTLYLGQNTEYSCLMLEHSVIP